MSASRRRHPRVVLRFPVTLLVDGVEQQLMIEDLSLSGMFVKTEDPLVQPGLMVTLTHRNLKGSTKVEVLRRYVGGVGLAFVEPAREFRGLVARILAENMESGQPFVDRRRAPRVAARIALLAARGGGHSVVFTSNLSETGLLVEATDVLGDTEHQTLILPEHGLFEVKVRIIRRTEDRIALEFVDPTHSFQEALHRVLVHLASAPI